MKKSIIILVTFILFICFSTVSQAGVRVSPAELSMNIDDCTEDGHFSGRITINISVTASVKHPDIVEWMRADRTYIKNLSWISVEPSYQVISSGNSSYCYVNISIPKKFVDDCVNQRWESWAAFKIGDPTGATNSSLREGYLIRVYVNTPVVVEVVELEINFLVFYFLIATLAIALLVLFAVLFFVKN